jgi:ADP-dependent NAD(P)H-hydrate dehydratase
MSRPTAVKPITAALLRAWPLPQPSHTAAEQAGKEQRGRVLVVGGGCRCPGSALLTGTAALRAGAGKLQMAVAQDAALALAVQMPEARVMGLRCDSRGEIATSSNDVDECVKDADAVVVGSGMEVAPATRQLADHLMRNSRAVFVLDAGGLDAALLGRLGRTKGPRGLVMTPHHGEMATMLDLDIGEIGARPLELAREFAERSGVVLVLKDEDTYIATPEGDVWVNRTGSVGLGTSGSGDVLAGIIGGLCARGATPSQAAVWGVFLHARAGAVLEKRFGALGYLAREIAAEVPAAMEKLGES